ncbi:Bifunctional pantoate ligase/cytidylate kinase [Includes: Pantothenate synthetase; Cytidylate kinase] [Cyanobium sp. NIES-981]|nr:Bifunctional pantoate ligase/cytidylate kinase [Includes: Pantothenate synthetase; Cytidylate kinase] [Cyanobium sp. NIES-981]
MGALHRGHQALIRAAATPRAGVEPAVLVSVFVNPLQFGPEEDFERYPRDLAADAVLADAAGAAALFAPEARALFPGGAGSTTRIRPPDSLTQSLCGPGRPGHFEGVATVVVRLLRLVRPHRLWLGEKDWQQLVILRRVITDLGLPVQVHGVGTVREPDGLPCSSRNSYLSERERQQAAALPGALAAVARRALQDPLPCASPPAQLRSLLEEQGLQVDYAQWVEAHTLQPAHRVSGLTLLAAAAHCGSARLIDHTFLMSRAPIVAIDGPAGAGKSTVTRAFASRLGLVYLDTGAMYRAVTWWLQHQGVDPSDPAAVAAQLGELDLGFRGTGEEQRVLLRGLDITEAIRSPEVTAAVSVVAAYGCVREALTTQQQAMGSRGGLVAEGRDIGTAVFPEADLKVFLTATVAERARRRARDLRERGFAVPSLAELEAQIAERDHRDSSRAVAPLQMAQDAVELVTDGMGIEAVIQALMDLFRERVPHDAWPDPLTGAA